MKKLIFNLRAKFNRFLFPVPQILWEMKLPVSRKFGFDRGKPIDRVLIERFLSENRSLISGRTLEIGDNRYTKQFGENVTESHVLDVNIYNKKADIISDLADMRKVSDSSFDTIILTHVLGMVERQEKAISEMYRALAPGGLVLVTTASFAPQQSQNKGFTRYTAKGLVNLFSKVFDERKLKGKDFGNVYTGLAFWIGLAVEDVPGEIFTYDDPEYPCIATLIAKK